MDPITKYFQAEKNESLLFVLVGLVSIALATYFFIKVKQPFYNGMAYPLIAVALIQLTVGCSVYLRSAKDIIRVENIAQSEISKIEMEEIPRMQTVMKNFTLYKWVEISLIVVGIIMFFFFPPMTLWKGMGLGLSVQAGFMLALDLFAESRGKTYLEYLQTMT